MIMTLFSLYLFLRRRISYPEVAQMGVELLQCKAWRIFVRHTAPHLGDLLVGKLERALIMLFDYHGAVVP